MASYIGEPLFMSENTQDVLLNARGICKTFPGVRALHQVDFSLRRLTIPSYERGVARLLRYDRHP